MNKILKLTPQNRFHPQGKHKYSHLSLIQQEVVHVEPTANRLFDT